MPLERALHLAGTEIPPLSGDNAPFAAPPGKTLGLIGPPGSGLTRLGLSLLIDPARRGMVAALDVRGWLCPLAAWQAGVEPERLVVVRCRERRDWSRVAAALIEGFPIVYAEVPRHPGDADLRRLAALARARRSSLVLRPLGDLPPGLLHLRLESTGVHWEGVGEGHGALLRRRLTVRMTGKGVAEQIVEVEDDGTHPLRVVPRLAVAPAGRAAG